MSGKIVKTQSLTSTLAGDENDACIIYYDGSAQSAKVQVTATTMVLTSGDTGSEAATAHDDGATAVGTLTFSETTVDTMGELKAVVETVDGWHMTLAACLDADDPANLKVVAATQVKTQAGVGYKWDNGDADVCTICVGPESDTSKNAKHRLSKSNHRRQDPAEVEDVVDNSLDHELTPYDTVARVRSIIDSAGTTTTDAAPVITIYEADQDGNETTLFTSAAGSDDTVRNTGSTQNWDWNSIVSQPGYRLVIRNTPGGATTDAINLDVIGAYGNPGTVAA